MIIASLFARSHLLFLILLTSIVPVYGQFQTRAEEIEAQRRQKAASLKPEEVSATEQALLEIKQNHLLERLSYGWKGLRGVFGNMATGQGFAFGPEYFNDELAHGQVAFRTSARASMKKAVRLDAEVALPRLADGLVFVDLLAMYRNYPQVEYYGSGPNSRRTGRTDFLYEDTQAAGTAGIRPMPHLRLGATGRYLKINVGHGTRENWATTQQTFTPAQAPGLDRQTDYVQGVGFVQYDWRDNPRGPRSGGNYMAEYSYNADQDFGGLYSFRRLILEAQQYIPVFNQRRVFALRGKSVISYRNAGEVVPFYMQAVLGGSDDLRGFRPYRFYDDNLIVFNAEYRYEIFSGLDMALFGDAGKVFHRRRDWNVNDLEGSYGFGFRFNARNNVFFRIDTGFSREGWQIWFKFNNVF